LAFSPAAKPRPSRDTDEGIRDGMWRTAPQGLDPKDANLRCPHFTANFNRIFRGATTKYLSEFDLARAGVVMFAEIDQSESKIAPALAERLQNPITAGFPIVLIHAARPMIFRRRSLPFRGRQLNSEIEAIAYHPGESDSGSKFASSAAFKR